MKAVVVAACALIFLSACGSGETGEETGGAETASGDSEVSASSSTSSLTTSSTTSSTTTSTTTSSTTTSSTTTVSPEAAGEHPRRATGAGTATVDGEAFTYEVYGCGWVISTVDLLHPGGDYAGEVVFGAEPGDSDNFDMYGVGEQPDGRLFNIAVSLRFGSVIAQVTYGYRGDPDGVLNFQGGVNEGSRLTIDDGRLTTTRPITVGPFGENVKVEVDATCESFGGSPSAGVEVAAEIVGIELFEGSGSVVVDDVEYPIVSTDICVTFEDRGEFAGTADDNGSEFMVNFADDGAQQIIQINLSPDRYLLGFGGAGQFFSVTGNRIATDAPVSLDGTDGVASSVTFDVTC